jgi:hypothetical protein
MRKFFLVLAVIALLASTGIAYAAPPEDGPPGLATAIAAQQRHNPVLLTTPGVVGTAVGLGEDGNPVVRVFTDRPGVAHIPAFLDGVPVVAQVTGKLTALKVSASRNTAPAVTIISPAPGAAFPSGASIAFSAEAIDAQEGDLSYKVIWTSSTDGFLGTGASITQTLSDGTHVITASATDSRRKTGKDTVTITVGGAPEQPDTTDLWPRPVPIGVSTGNYQSVSAGTIACRVRDKSGNVYALSNTHVYAPNDIDGQSEIGDTVTQPGLYDVATHVYDPSLRLGELTAYKPIDGFVLAFNDIDAAIALTNVGALDNHTPLGGYGVPNSVTTTAALNMAVQKFGRTTHLTKGTITGINGTLAVDYGGGWYAWFTGQIIVETSSAFILPGDSGSLLVTDDINANPVGLLFAGNADGTMAMANPIDAVLQYFGVAIDGK